MLLGEFQKGLRLCEGMPLDAAKPQLSGSGSRIKTDVENVRRYVRFFSYEVVRVAMSFLSLATAASVFS
jgi:hypothetical protein